MDKHRVITSEGIPFHMAMDFYHTLRHASLKDVRTVVEWIKDEKETIKLSLADCANDLRRFATAHGGSVADPISILHALFSLEGFRSSAGLEADELLGFLEQNVKRRKQRRDSQKEIELKAMLVGLFGRSAKLARTSKAQRVYDGLIPNYDSCWSLVEFRPIFDEARSQIVNGIVAASLSFQTRGVDSEQTLQTFAFQVDMADLEQMIEELGRVKSKIGTLRELAEKSVVLVNPTKSLGVKK